MNQVTERIKRINRPEFYCSFIAVALYVVAGYLTMNVTDITHAAILSEVANFCNNAAAFFGGFVAAVFAGRHIKAHATDINEPTRVAIYAIRFAVGIAFMFA